MMAITQQTVLAHVTQHSPIVGAKIASDLGSDSFLVGAYLSELIDSKQLFLTRSTAAGAPLYYVLSQHADIVVLREKLKEKDRRTFDLLQGEGVLREDDLDPLTRVSLKNLPDFAQSLNIKLGTETVTFWKWFLLSNDDVIGILQKKYIAKNETPKSNSNTPAQSESSVQATKKVVQTAISEAVPELNGLIEQLSHCRNTGEIISQIEQANIRISSSIDIKKNKESDCIIHIPTAFGVQKYFVKILFKKKITDTDLSSLFMQGSLKHMPICLITDGVLTKKAEILHNGDLDSVLVVRLLM